MQGVIKKKYGQDATNVGDEGGFAPNIQVSILLCPVAPYPVCTFTCSPLQGDVLPGIQKINLQMPP